MTELRSHGIPCSIRLRRGIDIQAGCGQLAGQSLGRGNYSTTGGGVDFSAMHR